MATSTPPPSLATVKRRLEKCYTEVSELWWQLHSVLDSKEPQIWRRWKKKKMAERARLLQAVWPEIPLDHRPDVVAHVAVIGKIGPEDWVDTDSAAMPYINLADLNGVWTALPSLLHYRGRRYPNEFLPADLDAVMYAVDRGRRVLPLIPGYFVRVNTEGLDDPLIAPDQERWDTELRTFPITDVLMTVEIQKRVWKFCLDCSLAILHDSPPAELFGAAQPSRTPDSAPLSAEVEHFLTLSGPMYRPVSRTSPLEGLRTIFNLVESRLSDDEDYLVQLKRHPPTLFERLTELIDHQPETITKAAQWDKIPNSEDHPLLSDVTRILVCGTLCTTLSFRTLHSAVDFALATARLVSDCVSPTVSQTQLLATSIREIARHSNSIATSHLPNLLARLRTVPCVEDARVPGMDDPDSLCFKSNCFDNKCIKAFFLLSEQLLLTKNEGVPFPTLKAIVELLQSCLDDPNLEVPGLLAEEISTVALCVTIADQVGRFYPIGHDNMVTVTFQQNELTPSHFNTLKQSAQLRQVFGASVQYDPNDFRIKARDVYIGRSMYYPDHRPRTEATVKAMRSAEELQDRFWTRISDHVRTCTGGSANLDDILFRNGRHVTDAPRTPPWGSIADDSNALQSPIQPALQPAEIPPPDPVEDRPRRPVPLPIMTKPKTRGPSHPLSDAPETEPGERYRRALSDTTPRFRFRGRRRFAVFCAMFPGDVPPQLKQARWAVFLSTMSDMGFAAEQVYGSVWLFTRTQDGEKITLHEPHPDRQVNIPILRVIGRRLSRRFGITREMGLEEFEDDVE